MRVSDVRSRFNPSTGICQVLIAGITPQIAKNTALQSLSRKEDPFPRGEMTVRNLTKTDVDTCESSGPRKGVEFKTELKHPHQLLNSICLAKCWLEETDFALSQVDDFILGTKKVVPRMVDKACNPEARKWVVAKVEKVWVKILETLHAQDLKNHVLAWKQNRTHLLDKDLGEVACQRNVEDIKLKVEPGLNMTINLIGSDFLTKPLKTLGEDFDLDAGIDRNTQLSHLNRGRGVNLGSIRIVDSNARISRDIDLHHAATIGEVIDAINSCGITDLNADISPSKKGLKLTYAGLNKSSLNPGFIVSETNGATARDLGISTNLLKSSDNQLGSLEGKDLDPILTLDTPLSLIKRGDGPTLGKIKIALGKAQKIVDLSSASNIREIIDTINNSITGVVASINNSKKGISIESTVAKEGLAVYDADEKETASTLGISGSSDMAGCFLFLMEALKNDDRGSIWKSLEILNLISLEILSYKEEVESKLKILESKRCRIIDLQSDATRFLPEVGGVDLFRAARDLAKQQSIYRTALQKGAAVIQLGLLNFIK